MPSHIVRLDQSDGRDGMDDEAENIYLYVPVPFLGRGGLAPSPTMMGEMREDVDDVGYVLELVSRREEQLRLMFRNGLTVYGTPYIFINSWVKPIN